MTKDDFYIIRNSITMQQVAESYGFKINNKGFIRCPFHGGGSERTPSLKIFPEYRGFHCKGCGTGGDVTRFVELYEGVDKKEAAMILSRRFNITISENGEISQETRKIVNKARLEHERELNRQFEIQADLRQTATLIHAYREVLQIEKPFSDTWCYIQNAIPKLIGEWDSLFQEMRK